MSIQCTKKFSLKVSGSDFSEYWAFENTNAGKVVGTLCNASAYTPGIQGQGVPFPNPGTARLHSGNTAGDVPVAPLAFDGSSSPGFFVSFWVQMPPPSGGSYGYFDRSDLGFNTAGSSGEQLIWDVGNSKWSLWMWTNGHAGNQVDFPFIFGTNNWYFVVLSYQTSTRLLSLYVNSVLLGTTTRAFAVPTNLVGGTFDVQKQFNGGFPFVVDELGFAMKLYPTQGNVNWLYNAGVGRTWPAVEHLGTA